MFKVQSSKFIILLMMATLHCAAQTKTAIVTAYAEFQPAVVYQADGRKLNLPKANIFLKNSSLLYESGGKVKEANIKTLLRVDFKDRSYFRIDTLLAYQVDTIGSSALFCAQLIDVTTYQQLIRNSKNITNLDLSWMVNYATIDATDNDDYLFPLIPQYYFRLGDQFVLVHERTLKRALNKEKRRLMETIINQGGFSWTDEKSLLNLLKWIQ